MCVCVCVHVCISVADTVGISVVRLAPVGDLWLPGKIILLSPNPELGPQDRSITLTTVYSNAPGATVTFNGGWTGGQWTGSQYREDDVLEQCLEVEDLSHISFAATPNVQAMAVDEAQRLGEARRSHRMQGFDEAQRIAENLASAAG